jgi:hypothetical protein
VLASGEKALRAHELLILPAWILDEGLGLAFRESPDLFFMGGIKENDSSYLGVVLRVEGTGVEASDGVTDKDVGRRNVRGAKKAL